MRWKGIFFFLLILSSALGLGGFTEVQAQAQYSLNLQTTTWNHSTLSVLITVPSNESWWNPSYLNATLRAIGQWNSAIQDFTSNYTNYVYLSELRMVPTTSNTMDSGSDVHISWTQKPPSGANEIGYTNVRYTTPSRIIINSTVNLYSQTPLAYVLNEVDMQNVALHELGHCLGLGHSNYTGDIMYPATSVSPVDHAHPLSTLDLYGVSTVFQWISTSSFPYSPQQSSVTLPSNIAYQYLPISDANLPPSNPVSSLIDEFVKLMTSGSTVGLIFLIVGATVIAIVIGVAIIRIRRGKTKDAGSLSKTRVSLTNRV